MTARDDILAGIRAHRPAGDFPDPLVPLFDTALPNNLLDAFATELERMGGKFLRPEGKSWWSLLDEQVTGAAVVVSNVPEVAGTRSLDPDAAPNSLADVDLGVVRAAFAVAETGSICLTDDTLGLNTLGYLPQHLLVLLDPADIVLNIHHAYRRPEWRHHHYAVFHTGPSATADIEGVLIHGAQGVRSLSLLPMPRGAGGVDRDALHAPA